MQNSFKNLIKIGGIAWKQMIFLKTSTKQGQVDDVWYQH